MKVSAPPATAVSCLRHPVLRAFGVGALSYISPRLLGLLFARLRSRRREIHTRPELLRILKQSLEIHRFPVFCGFTVALNHLLQPLFDALFSANSLSSRSSALLSRNAAASFFASSTAAAGGLCLLNSKSTGDAGRTLDLTLFALARAADIVVGELWQRRKDRRVRSGRYTRLEKSLGYLADPAVFALSCSVIMFAWFYTPEKLPAAYNKQITKMANADQRLVTTLQQIRNGKFIYGYEHVGRTSPLESYCEDLDLPKEWGNPAKTVPIPCEVVHGGSTKICEVYALKRAWTAIWSTALPIYLGLNAVKFLRPQVPQPKALLKALLGAFRSSAFLGSFVGLFWYAICLTRTRLGPKFTSLDPLALENLGIKVGCAMCGWSILVENPKRRTEIAFFVVPRALACLVPRKYGRKYQWIETTAFSVSAGILLATIKHNPTRVRGVFGRLLRNVTV